MNYIYKLGLTLLLCALLAPAQAAMVATPGIAQTASGAAQASLEQRRHTVQQLVEHGVETALAEERVAQMTDAQVLRLQGEIEALPAGGVSTTNLLLIIILILILI